MPELTAADEASVSNPFARIVTVFFAPTKAFRDVKRSPTWWAPWLVAALVGLVYAYTVLHVVGLPALVDGVVKQSPALEQQIASAPPEQAAKIRHQIEGRMKALYFAPVFGVLGGLLCAGVLLASANFGAGGRARFVQMLAVWFYGTMPLTLFYALVVAAIFAGAASDPFVMQNPIGTNVGFYLADSGLPKMVLPLLNALDVFAIWTAVVLIIGVSLVAEIKRGIAAMIVVGWWIVFILLQTAGSALSG